MYEGEVYVEELSLGASYNTVLSWCGYGYGEAFARMNDKSKVCRITAKVYTDPGSQPMLFGEVFEVTKKKKIRSFPVQETAQGSAAYFFVLLSSLSLSSSLKVVIVFVMVRSHTISDM